MYEYGCYRARRLSFHLFIYLCLFFFLCFATLLFFFSLYFFIAHTHRSSILIKIIKSGKALFFLSDKPNFVSPNFIVTPTRRVWSVSYNTQKSFPIYPCFFCKFLIFLYSLLHFSNLFTFKGRRKAKFVSRNSKVAYKKKTSIGLDSRVRTILYQGQCFRKNSATSILFSSTFFLPFIVSLYAKHTEISNR